MLSKQSSRFGKGTERYRNQRTSRDNPDYSIIKIGPNTKKSPGDLRRLADTQTLVRNHQQMSVWKILKGVNNNDDNKIYLVWFGFMAYQPFWVI